MVFWGLAIGDFGVPTVEANGFGTTGCVGGACRFSAVKESR